MVRARSPRFFSLLSSLSFPISLAPRLRRDAFIFLFIFSFYFCFFSFFLLLFIFLFFLFVFFFLLFFLLFLFFLLLLSLPSLFFLFVFLLSFYLCFSSSFFVFLFVLLFYPPRSKLFPHYPTARRPFIFSLPSPIFPISSSHFPAAAKRKKYRQKNPRG